MVTLSPGETKAVDLPAYCVNASWHAPEGAYAIGSLAPDTLMSLVNYLKTKNVPQGFDSLDPNAFAIMFGVQEQVWGLTDECKSFDSILQALDVLFSAQ